MALVPKVDQALVRALRESGVVSYDDLLVQFDEQRLAHFERGHGGRKRKVGAAAKPILRSAQALAFGKEIVIQAPVVPQARNYAMFDLEGLPPQLDELEKIYLWGIQVYGAEPSEYLGAAADSAPTATEKARSRSSATRVAFLINTGASPSFTGISMSASSWTCTSGAMEIRTELQTPFSVVCLICYRRRRARSRCRFQAIA